MPTRIETRIEALERRLSHMLKEQMRRFESIEQRMAEVERDGFGEVWSEMMEQHQRVQVLERECQRVKKQRTRKKRSRR